MGRLTTKQLAHAMFRMHAVFAVVVVLMSPAVGVHAAPVPDHSIQCTDTRRHHDGDTFIYSPAQGAAAFVVRVASIDAPEAGQAYWHAARARLRGTNFVMRLAPYVTWLGQEPEDAFGEERTWVLAALSQRVATSALSLDVPPVSVLPVLVDVTLRGGKRLGPGAH